MVEYFSIVVISSSLYLLAQTALKYFLETGYRSFWTDSRTSCIDTKYFALKVQLESLRRSTSRRDLSEAIWALNFERICDCKVSI